MARFPGASTLASRCLASGRPPAARWPSLLPPGHGPAPGSPLLLLSPLLLSLFLLSTHRQPLSFFFPASLGFACASEYSSILVPLIHTLTCINPPTFAAR